MGLNTGLAYLAAVLIKSGHQVRVLDLNTNEENVDQRLHAELDKAPDVVGTSIKTFTYRDAKAIIQKAHKYNPTPKYVAGGPHVTLRKAELFREIPELDALFIGEGEGIFGEYVRKFAAGEKVSSGPGILVQDGTPDVPAAPRSYDINSFPFPEYSVFDTFSNEIMNPYPLVTSRGCPYSCVYCSVPIVTGKRFIWRSSESVIGELKYVKEKFGVKEFIIIDDDFTLLMDHCKELCRKMIEAKLGLSWSCPNGIRADRVDLELLKLMKQAGCTSVHFGVESLCEPVFDGIKKGEKLESIVKAVKLAKEAGIKVAAYFIIGLPGSNFEREIESIEAAKRLKIENAHFNMLSPYPGTEVWSWVKEHGKFLRDTTEAFHFGGIPDPVFETEDFPAEQRKKAFVIAWLRHWNFMPTEKYIGENPNFIVKFVRYWKLVWQYDRRMLPRYIKEFFFFKGLVLVRYVLFERRAVKPK
jgi:radical SAM superfamily enzyme YgiQ (UPF0313 family)